VTKVSVRVATFGDKDFSDRILDQISAHLAYGQPVNSAAGAATPAGAVVPAGWKGSGEGPTSTGTPLGPPTAAPQSSEPPKADKQ
jgi:hypothetical protein